MTDEIRVSSIEIDGIRTIIRECRSPDHGEAVVMLHGNPGSSEDYACLLPVAGKATRALAPDMPGFGKTDRPYDFDYSVPGYAQFLGRLLEKLYIQRAQGQKEGAHTRGRGPHCNCEGRRRGIGREVCQSLSTPFLPWERWASTSMFRRGIAL